MLFIVDFFVYILLATIFFLLNVALLILVKPKGQPRAHERLEVLANGPGVPFHVGRQPVCWQRAPQAVPLGLRELHVFRADVYVGRVLPGVLLADRRFRLGASGVSQV